MQQPHLTLCFTCPLSSIQHDWQFWLLTILCSSLIPLLNFSHTACLFLLCWTYTYGRSQSSALGSLYLLMFCFFFNLQNLIYFGIFRFKYLLWIYKSSPDHSNSRIIYLIALNLASVNTSLGSSLYLFLICTFASQPQAQLLICTQLLKLTA